MTVDKRLHSLKTCKLELSDRDFHQNGIDFCIKRTRFRCDYIKLCDLIGCFVQVDPEEPGVNSDGWLSITNLRPCLEIAIIA